MARKIVYVSHDNKELNCAPIENGGVFISITEDDNDMSTYQYIELDIDDLESLIEDLSNILILYKQ